MAWEDTTLHVRAKELLWDVAMSTWSTRGGWSRSKASLIVVQAGTGSRLAV